VHGGGHGDYRTIVLAPSSVQEAIDLTTLAFDLADQYRSIATVLLDGSLGQMMEPAELPAMQPLRNSFPEWAACGALNRPRNFLSSIYLNPIEEEQTNLRLMRRWQEIEACEVRYKSYYMEDARFAVIGFGSSGRIALSAVRAARAEGIPVGLLRPITLNPFPTQVVAEISQQVESLLVVEMNAGQMLEDVRLAVAGRTPVEFFGRLGGVVPFPDEVLDEIRSLAAGNFSLLGHPRDRWLERMAQLTSVN
jgi:2-oxoglutarate/2-oxoacid ferredoxin oxidoreductase subunit alpha